MRGLIALLNVCVILQGDYKNEDVIKITISKQS